MSSLSCHGLVLLGDLQHCDLYTFSQWRFPSVIKDLLLSLSSWIISLNFLLSLLPLAQLFLVVRVLLLS